MKLLFIDDENAAIMLLKQQCKFNNIDADFIKYSLTIKNVDLSKYDLVITDFMMSDLDGIELIKYCKTQNNNLHFALMTAVSEIGLIERAYNLPIDAYIVKPLDFNKILELIENIKYHRNKKNNIDKLDKQINEMAQYGK